MTFTLAAVYAPIGFLGGLICRSLRDFAFTLAGSVIVYGVIALTLSPMMCSMLLKTQVSHSSSIGPSARERIGTAGRLDRSLHYR